MPSEKIGSLIDRLSEDRLIDRLSEDRLDTLSGVVGITSSSAQHSDSATGAPRSRLWSARE